MALYDQIIKIYPTLASTPEVFANGTITLRNDSDGKGDYIDAWNHPTLVEPTLAQLAAA